MPAALSCPYGVDAVGTFLFISGENTPTIARRIVVHGLSWTSGIACGHSRFFILFQGQSALRNTFYIGKVEHQMNEQARPKAIARRITRPRRARTIPHNLQYRLYNVRTQPKRPLSPAREEGLRMPEHISRFCLWRFTVPTSASATPCWGSASACTARHITPNEMHCRNCNRPAECNNEGRNHP